MALVARTDKTILICPSNRTLSNPSKPAFEIARAIPRRSHTYAEPADASPTASTWTAADSFSSHPGTARWQHFINQPHPSLARMIIS